MDDVQTTNACMDWITLLVLEVQNKHVGMHISICDIQAVKFFTVCWRDKCEFTKERAKISITSLCSHDKLQPGEDKNND